MKKLIILLFLSCWQVVYPQCVGFYDSTKKNRFLDGPFTTCQPQTIHTKNNYQEGYNCGNHSVSAILNLNFLSLQSLGKQFYIFNQFMDSLASHVDSKIIASDTKFSGTGVFMIEIGTSFYLQQIVAPQLAKSCPAGQQVLCAQLKYNDGNGIYIWSQDAICLSATDSFEIHVSDNKDTKLLSPAAKISTDRFGINWMKDPGPIVAVYEQASNSPRSVKLVKKSTASNEAVDVATAKTKGIK
ncbi:MAG: hypothetical protein ACXWL2_03280 [Candidatus Chromulinivorax sp.]